MWPPAVPAYRGDGEPAILGRTRIWASFLLHRAPWVMPKKFQGENTKSAAARARKAEAKAAADAKRQQELEDAYWKDEDKHVMRKEQRKVND